MKDMQPKTISRSFEVEYSYQLHFTRNVFDVDNRLLADILKGAAGQLPMKVIIVADKGVLDAHKDIKTQVEEYTHAHKEILELREFIQVPGGEAVKNSKQALRSVLDAINTKHICRHSVVIAIGGGAVIDMAGYAASIAHRGVKLIRIPTTVLAQNDAAVGVKNGVNAFGKKNFLGAFGPPLAIINDVEFLKTLEDRDWRAGIAEAIKVSLLKDPEFFNFIEENIVDLNQRDENKMQALIYKCAELHMDHIAHGGDPFEQGSSRPLDFGHWSAHKLEQMTNYELRHGEAVAMGMALDVVYANRSGILNAEVTDRVLRLLMGLGFNLRIPLESEKEIEFLLEGIEEFREHLGGRLTITLISDIGKAKDVHEIDRALMRQSIIHQMQANNQSVA